MKMAVGDTHTVIWALLRPEYLSQRAKDIFRQAQQQRLKMAVPSICLVEVTYLVEKGRLDSATRDSPTAVHLGLPLVSRDRKIRASSVTTIW